MKQIAILFALILTTALSGCSGGGSSSPVSTVTAPSIVSISPSSGGPGTLVTIQGSRFGAFKGTSVVVYSGIDVQPSSWSDTMITVLVPQTAQANGTFQVVVNGQISNYSTAFTISKPVISYITPQSANAGAQVIVTGQYFGASKGSSYISFNAQQATTLSWTDSSIACLVPASLGSQSGPVSVVVYVNGVGSSNTFSFNYSAPSISSVSPVGDNIGATVSINGQGFGQSQSLVNGSLTVGGFTAQILSWNDNLIQFRVPQVSNAGSAILALTINGRQITSSFTVEAPTTTGQSPNPVSKDQVLTIYGNHFGQSTDSVSRSVIIDGSQVAGVFYYDTYLSFTWPISNDFWGNQTKSVTINIGGLTTSISITAD